MRLEYKGGGGMTPPFLPVFDGAAIKAPCVCSIARGLASKA